MTFRHNVKDALIIFTVWCSAADRHHGMWMLAQVRDGRICVGGQRHERPVGSLHFVSVTASTWSAAQHVETLVGVPLRWK
jgi:hypothetical protein